MRLASLAFVGAFAASTLPASSNDRVTYVAGSSRKVCQLSGEVDRQFNKPTFNQTRTRFGLIGNDLGYSFEHDGKLFFLFGDSQPSPTFRGKPNGRDDPPRLHDDNDAIAFTSDTSINQCVRLDFVRNAIGAYKNPVVQDAQGKPAITLSGNEMPIAGLSQGGRMFVIFGTDNPTHDARPPGPLGFSTRTVVGVSDDDAGTFHYLYDFSKGPGAKFINTTIARSSDGYLYFWGSQGGALYGHSAVFFARKRADQIAQAGGMEYLAGLDRDGTPRFSTSESDASALFADREGRRSEARNCARELGVEWNRFVKRWVMLYNCLNRTPANLPGIYMRLAEQPWGPWSAPQTIFNARRDGGYCAFIHRAVTPGNPACDDLASPASLERGGGGYGPYFLSRFTTGDESRAVSTFYYTLSTWNPYTQVIMKTTIQGSP